MVSFTFDDFPRSALTVAGDLLAEHGLRGTYYAAMGLMGHQTSVGEICDAADLRNLIEAGHELGCHTFGHLSCHRMATSQWQQDCERNRRVVADLLGGQRLRNFSFPYGDVTLTAKASLLASYDSCRTVKAGINRNPVDLGFLRATSMYSTRPLQELQRLLADNIEQAGWLILYTHDVDSQPSAYGCTPAYFREVLTCAIASGASIVTVAEAVNRFRPRQDRSPAGELAGRATS
jgi:peptidoglycan/xylan/chitin deacetylase (PgdA/CDA1 family)